MWRLALGVIWILRRLGVSTAREILSPPTQKLIREAETVEVFSLGGVGEGKGSFFGAPVLGSVVVASKRVRKRLVNRILLANRYNIGGFKCLGAEYGVRIRVGDVTYDLTFCFGCSQVWVNGSDGHYEYGSIAAFPIPLLDKILTDAGVPIPPPTEH